MKSDWWVVADTPFGPPGDWYSYVYAEGWLPGIQHCSQVSLFSLSSFEVLNTTLPSGDYLFYFALDNNADDVFDATWLDSVHVKVE